MTGKLRCQSIALTLIIVLLLLSASGCGSASAENPDLSDPDAADDPDIADNPDAADAPDSESAAIPDTTEAPDIEAVERSLKEGSSKYAEVFFPGSWFGETDGLDMEKVAHDNGFILAEDIGGEVVRAVMTAERRDEMQADYADSLDAEFKAMVGAKSTPYIKDIIRTDDFKLVVVLVDRKKYEEHMFDMTPLIIGIHAATYQIFTDNKPSVHIKILDAETGEVISEEDYPTVGSG